MQITFEGGDAVKNPELMRKQWFYRFNFFLNGFSKSGGNTGTIGLSDFKMYVDDNPLYLYLVSAKYGFILYGPDPNNKYRTGDGIAYGNSYNTDDFFTSYQDAYDNVNFDEGEVLFNLTTTNSVPDTFWTAQLTGSSTQANFISTTKKTVVDFQVAKMKPGTFITKIQFSIKNPKYNKATPEIKLQKFDKNLLDYETVLTGIEIGDYSYEDII